MLNKVKLFRFQGETVPLEKLCIEIVDCHHSTPKWTTEGKLVIRNFNIKNGRLHLDDCSFTDEVSFNERIGRSRPEPGDLIITREAPMGEVCIIPEGIECCLGQRMVLIKPDLKKVSSKYLLYALQSEFVQKQIQMSDKTGSIVSNLRIPVLKNLFIPSFDVKVEENIGNVLDSIVSKISLNNRINAELEAMAKTIYDYWFVQFDFPDKKGKPYKASGGKMVWSEELKREIPEGWEVSNILKLGELLGGGTPKTSIASYWDGEIPFFTPSDSTTAFFVTKTEKSITQNGLDSCSSDLFKPGSIFITARGTVGKVNIAGRSMAMNQSCYAVAPRNGVNTPFLHQSCINLVHYLKVKGSGSVFDAIVSNDIKFTSISIPPLALIDKYGVLVNTMYDKILNNINENQKFTELRDWLLPMLMNGQIKIKDAEHLSSKALAKDEEVAIAAEPEVNYSRESSK